MASMYLKIVVLRMYFITFRCTKPLARHVLHPETSGRGTKQSHDNTCLFTCSDFEHLNTRTICYIHSRHYPNQGCHSDDRRNLLGISTKIRQVLHFVQNDTHLFTCSDCEHLNTRTIWLPHSRHCPIKAVIPTTGGIC